MILRKKKKKNYDPSHQLVGKQRLDIDKSKTLFANVACGFLELCHEKVFVTCFKGDNYDHYRRHHQHLIFCLSKKKISFPFDDRVSVVGHACLSICSSDALPAYLPSPSLVKVTCNHDCLLHFFFTYC